jgi:hypothetical protein
MTELSFSKTGHEMAVLFDYLYFKTMWHFSLLHLPERCWLQSQPVELFTLKKTETDMRV